MDLGNFRKMSVKIGKEIRNDKKLCMSSGKRRMHFVSGRHYDDHKRNATDVFWKTSEAFYNFRSSSSSHKNYRRVRVRVTLTGMYADIARSF